ncbi:MAG: hypothetical protein IJH37_03020 [Clostridia bacterium]|nr:hypothetical protein [Clostridia bacterium]
MRLKIPCKLHKDCFALTNGTCVCLSDNRFKGKECPFYKSKAQNDRENARTSQYLVSIGRADLVEQYRGKSVYA